MKTADDPVDGDDGGELQYFRHRKSGTEGAMRAQGSEGSKRGGPPPADSLGNLEAVGNDLRSRLSPGDGRRPGRPTVPNWSILRKISMSADTLGRLEWMALQLSDEHRRVSPMQVAGLLLEQAVCRASDAAAEA